MQPEKKIVYDGIDYPTTYDTLNSLRDEPEEQEIASDVLTTAYSAIENNYFGQRYRADLYLFDPDFTLFEEMKTLTNKTVDFYPNIDNTNNIFPCKVR